MTAPAVAIGPASGGKFVVRLYCIRPMYDNVDNNHLMPKTGCILGLRYFSGFFVRDLDLEAAVLGVMTDEADRFLESGGWERISSMHFYIAVSRPDIVRMRQDWAWTERRSDVLRQDREGPFFTGMLPTPLRTSLTLPYALANDRLSGESLPSRTTTPQQPELPGTTTCEGASPNQ